jgi:hypothetical protein
MPPIPRCSTENHRRQRGIVWNCWTGALARLGVERANALQAKNSTGADAARVRAIAAYKDFLTLWKDADPDIPILKQAKAEYVNAVALAFVLSTYRVCCTSPTQNRG